MKRQKVSQNEIRTSIANTQNLWTKLLEVGMMDTIDEEELLDLIEMKKQYKIEQKILKQHIDNFYHIWKNEKGRYLSYLPAPDKPKGRMPVTAVTQEKLERKIIDFYQKQERQKQLEAQQERFSTLRAIYPVWLKVKALETTASSYIRRIDSDWTAYYLQDPIIDWKIRSMTKADLKEWTLKKIRDCNMTKTQYYNMSIIIRQILDWCVDHELLVTNPFRQFKIDSKLFVKKKKPDDSTQVFLTWERPAVEKEAWEDFQKKGCTTALAIPLAFQIGVRIGELVALKESDITRDGKYLHIQRMAQRQAKQRPDGTWSFSEWKIVEHLKSSAGDRYIFLTKEARKIIQTILAHNRSQGYKDEGFLFVHGGKRINPRAVDYRLRKYCDHINIDPKSEHKIRKSYISSLIDGGININEVRKQAGHEDERTTYKNYCFNRKTRVENEEDMEKALAV